MHSSISSFRVLFNLLYLGTIGLVAIGLFTLRSPAARLRIINVHPYPYLETINKTVPDMVLVGNSMLYHNIDKALLESILSQHLGRPTHVLILGEGGAGSAWWYLVLKHHVAPSAVHAIPVGVFFRGYDLSSYNRRLNPNQHWAVNKLLTDDDAVFFKKVGERYRTETKIYHYLPSRLDLVHYLLRQWTDTFLWYFPPRTSAEALLQNRFQIKNVQPWETMDPGSAESLPEGADYCVQLTDCVDRTLLPDMIQEMQNNRFFVVEVHSRSASLSDTNGPQYRGDLKFYLTERHIPVLSLAQRPELNAASLYLDDIHLNDRGRSINTKVFADKLLKSGLLEVGNQARHE